METIAHIEVFNIIVFFEDYLLPATASLLPEFTDKEHYKIELSGTVKFNVFHDIKCKNWKSSEHVPEDLISAVGRGIEAYLQ